MKQAAKKGDYCPSGIARVLRALSDAVYPCRCHLCRSYAADFRSSLCPSCYDAIGTACLEPACPRCAGSIGPYGAKTGTCDKCRGRALRIAGTTRIGRYDGLFGEAIRQFKYHGVRQMLPALGALLVEKIESAPWFERIEATVSVPTHWRHRMRRPLYAAEVLADCVASKLDLPNVRLLRRTRAGPHQIGLSFTQRQANVRGAFALTRGVKITEARVLLVDDVRTTGATLEECAGVLLRGGCGEVYAAVAAIAGHAKPTGHAITEI